MTPNEIRDEICTPKMPESIFRPIKSKIKARPFFKWWKRCRMLSIKKNSARRPIIANILEVNTINKFCEIANTAGIESTANIISVLSINIIIKKSEVKANLPFSLQKNLPLWWLGLNGRYLSANFRILLFLKSTWSSFYPVIIWYLYISKLRQRYTTPSKIDE